MQRKAWGKAKKQNRKTGRNHIMRKTTEKLEGRQEGTHLSKAKRLSGMGGRKKNVIGTPTQPSGTEK